MDASQDNDGSGRIQPLMSLGKKGRHTPSKSQPLSFYPEHSALSDTDRTEWGHFHLLLWHLAVTVLLNHERTGLGLFQGTGTR